MIIKELFEGLLGDFCIALNTIKCLFNLNLSQNCVKRVIIRTRTCVVECCIRVHETMVWHGLN